MKKFFYPTGEEVRPGDRIRYHGEPGEVEFVATKLTGDPQFDYYVEFEGGGVMIKANNFGNVLVTEQDSQSWELVSRAVDPR